jgi:hypothetical protein
MKMQDVNEFRRKLALLLKGGKPVGSTTTRADGKTYRKVADGEWVPVKEGGEKRRSTQEKQKSDKISGISKKFLDREAETRAHELVYDLGYNPGKGFNSEDSSSELRTLASKLEWEQGFNLPRNVRNFYVHKIKKYLNEMYEKKVDSDKKRKKMHEDLGI